MIELLLLVYRYLSMRPLHPITDVSETKELVGRKRWMVSEGEKLYIILSKKKIQVCCCWENPEILSYNRMAVSRMLISACPIILLW